MPLRHPLAVAVTLALAAPATVLTASSASASAAATPSAVTSRTAAAVAAPSAVGHRHLPRPVVDKSPAADHEPHTVLVKFRPTASSSTRSFAVKRRGGTIAGTVHGTSFVRVRTVGDAADAVRTLRADPAVAAVTLDYVRTASVDPNDPGFTYGDQDYLKTVRVPAAWDRAKGSLSTVVAVVDSGVDGTHADLSGRTVAGFDAITDLGIAAGAASDDNGHGSMVAGIVAAATNNGQGIAGVAWNARVMPVKVLDSTGSGSDSDVIQGITWAVDHGARIVNLSLGGPDDSPALHDAVTYAVTQGAVVVVAAGNDGDATPQYPAAYPESLAVGATDTSGRLTDFSSHGTWVDIAAPGFGITSTWDDGGYATGDGTSFSAPIVAGAAALVRTQTPTLTAAQVVARLKGTARDAGPRGIDPYFGAGILDVANAVGGSWAADFPAPATGMGEPNDVPGAATAMTTSASGTLAVEGDVDWYALSPAAAQSLTVTVTPAAYDATRAQNADPVLDVYDADLRLVGEADAGISGEPESLTIVTGTGPYHVSVRSWNGAADSRAYTVSTTVTATADAPTPGTTQEWVRTESPLEAVTGVALTATPSVTFQRDVDPASVTSSTVRLLHGRTGAVAPATVTWDAVNRRAALRPTAPLQDNTPYRIEVSGVQDTSPAPMEAPFTSTFRTVDLPPAAAGSFTAKGGLRTAALTWKAPTPSISDLDQYVVRMVTGTTPPTTVTSGTGVYAGTGTGVTVNLAQGTTYSFRIWVRDRSGRYSPNATAVVHGTGATVTSTVTTLRYGGWVTLSGVLTRRNPTAAVASAPVQLYVRTVGATSWTLLTTRTSTTTGAVSFAHKPAASVDYMWVYRGSATLVGSSSVQRRVTVAPLVTSAASRTSFALGGTFTLSGSVAPTHAGRTIYLQRYAGNGVWRTVTSRALTSTSTYAFTVKPTVRGTNTYRTYLPAHTDHLAGYSPNKAVSVR